MGVVYTIMVGCRCCQCELESMDDKNNNEFGIVIGQKKCLNEEDILYFHKKSLII